MMKQAVLYVCHGSRVPEACREALAFIDKVKPLVDVPIQETGFLELAEPTIGDGFKACVDKGATHIAVVPLLLLTAAHAKQDIPEELAHVASNYPDIKLTYGKPIGVDEKIADILLEKMNEKEALASDSIAILVGRGSSDPDVKRDFAEIARQLQEKSSLKQVKACFLTAAEPSFDDVIRDIHASNEQQIYLLPYLIFTGLLKKGIDKTVQSYDWGNRSLYHCDYLGAHPLLLNIFMQRVQETVENKNNEYVFHVDEYASVAY
ncbi:sirohydrochlorin chelatase [Metabacillus fastidiosus]|uniref:sirohydrochlorin chelatase n=1 Tax=Metabacillus fastidiosus TaxID=1458 RepID=UPI002E210BB0|nr:sirohydrochlorin chelatase [Metabacillus fastidiosus]